MNYKKYMCVICGFIYDEAEGWPEDGIEAGTFGKKSLKIGFARIVAHRKKILK